MNFAELKQNLKLQLKNNYLLTGSDLFLLSRAYELISKRVNVNFPDFNLQVFAGDEIDFAQVIMACDVMPLMDEYRLVYVNASIKSNIINTNSLKDYLEHSNPTTILVMSVGPDNDKAFDKIKSMFEVVDCNKITQSLIEGFVSNQFAKSGKTISKDALQELINYTSGDMARIDNEIVKLVSYVGLNQSIEKEDIRQVVTKSVDFQIYELTDALAKKNSVKVYEILDALKARKDTYRTIVSLIYNHFRRLFHISVAKSSNQELAQMLSVKEFAVSKMQQQAKSFGAKKLKQINDLCMKLDFETKQSETSVDMAIEYLVLTILNI